MNETIILTPRQKAILNLLAQTPSTSRSSLATQLPPHFQVSKASLARDLATLLTHHLIRSEGRGPSTRYFPSTTHPLLSPLDLTQYFSLSPDVRHPQPILFNPPVLAQLPGIISYREHTELAAIYRSFSDSTQRLDSTILKRELKRYVIELAWKSSVIEGNTYTLLETENLLLAGTHAPNHSSEEATMILNHQTAFQTILANRDQFQVLTANHIFELHNIMIKNLRVTTGIRQHSVGVTGTAYRPLDNEWQIREQFDAIIKLTNATPHPLEKSLFINALFAYLQPFADGNKRTARMLGNAILLAHDYFPLSYRSLDENEYKQALIVFYELNNLFHFKRLFLDQYRFALTTYFR